MNTAYRLITYWLLSCSILAMPISMSMMWPKALAAQSSASEQAQEEHVQEEHAQQDNPYRYKFTLNGIKDTALRDAVLKSAELTTLKDVAPNSLRALERRVFADIDMIKITLRAHGYFDAEIRQSIEKKDGLYQVVLDVNKHQLYKIGNFRLFLAAKKNDDKARALVDAALADGKIIFPRGRDALPQYVQAPEQAALSVLMQHGYPYPHVTERLLIVDHKEKTVTVHLSMNAGPKAFFGSTRLYGLQTVDDSFIERRIAWKKGEPFDIRKVTKTQRDISRSGVIGSARVQYGGRPSPPQDKAERVSDGASLPMRVRMEESNHKTLGAGLSYSTSLGPAANLFWEHRNVFGGAERFRADLDVGTSIYGIGAAFNKPDFFDKRSLSYQSSFKLKDERLEAYDRRGINFTNGVTWQASNRLSFNGGFGFEQAQIKEKDRQKDNFTLLSLPLMAKYDSSDDLLNPQKGWRISAGVTPYKALNSALSFIANDISANHYWPLSSDIIWANRAKFGALYGDSVLDIPADKRLYSGGGGSVRGYGFQMVGPLDHNGDPLGGRMQIEASTEMRFRITDTIGGVSFVDAGRVSEDIGGQGDVLYSAGVGVRYFTVAGPVRFDVAIPLNKRPQDDSYQIYISLGQAF